MWERRTSSKWIPCFQMSDKKTVTEPYCGDHFTVYAHTESIGCTPNTNILLYFNYTSVF